MDTLETRTTTSAAPSANSTDSVGEEKAACCAPAPQSSPDHTQRLAALAERLKAIADPTRLRMLELLARQSAALCVCEITDQFTLHQPTISHHLRLLREAGLIAGEKRGTWSYYWATDEGKRVLASVRSLA
jgi:ArsR family transcriptional regulator, arsenate/arsenite/antimonite-responsive transcriptional repressor